MPDQRPTLLLTRPETQSRRFAAQFAEKFGDNWPTILAPLQKIVALECAIPAARQLIFTSENAVAPLLALTSSDGRRAWCVGARTAQVAAKAGFEVVVGGGTAEVLAQRILAERPMGPLLHARGRHAASNMGELLNLAGIETFEAEVYDQIAQPLSAAGAALLRGTASVLVPVFSPRSARLFAQAAAGATAPMLIAAISTAAASPLDALHPTRLEIALQPGAGGVLAALARLMAP